MPKYKVCAYVCTNFSGLMDSLETDNFDEVQDFVWLNVQHGYNCELIDNECGERNCIYADGLNEYAIDYNDLLMEQQEQM